MNGQHIGSAVVAGDTEACAESTVSAIVSPPPSFAAFVADVHFAGDLCIGLAVPLVMLGSIARSLDPRVGGGQGQAAAGPGAGPTCAGPPPWEARDDFPLGASVSVQVLHVARHVVWYTMVRPRHGDWVGLLITAMNVVYPCTMLLVAVSPRTGRVWAWWRRHRLAFLSTATLLGRCVLMVSTFLLLPPAAWATYTWAGYVVSASSRPLANALALSVYDQFAKVLLPGATLHALAQTAVVFLLAYLVAPTIVTMQRQQLQRSAGTSTCDDNNAASIAPVPLQCGLRPEHSALLPCRPLALQVLLGLAMVAWPVWLSWAVERRLRRQYADLCADWGRRQRVREKKQSPAEQHAVWEHQDATLRSTSLPAAAPLSRLRRLCSWFSNTTPPGSRAHGRPSRGPGDALTALAPAAVGGQDSSRHGEPQGAACAATPSARYRSARTSLVVSLKVQEHPGSFEEYGNHLASLLRAAVRDHSVAAPAAGAAAAAERGPSAYGGLGNPVEGTMRLRAAPAAAAAPVLHTAVIRGCVQAVLWGWVPEGFGDGAEGDAVAARRLLQRLAGLLGAPGLAVGGAGGVRGVSVQVGQAVAVARDTCETGDMRGQEEEEQEDEEEEAVSRQGVKKDGSSNVTSRLLKLSPPAAAASGPLAVRLLLHSPAPQPARVLVLAERHGRGGAVPPRAVLLRELAVALEGGVQEVEVELGAGELAGAGEGGGLPGGVGVLRVMLVGPVHVPQGPESAGQQEGPCPAPLVHWVAPPLLLLPEEAAGELCGLWGQMKREQEEEREQQQGQQQGQDQEQLGHAAPGIAVQHAASPSGPAAALAGFEQESCLWWSHMAPLMADLAYVLSAWHGQDQESEDVRCQLLDFLYSNGLHRTAVLLRETPSCNGHGTAQAALSVPTAPSVSCKDAISASAAAIAAASAAPAPAAAAGGGLPEPTALCALQLELGLRRWPPGQEAAYRAYVRQRASSPPLTLVDVASFVIMVLRSALGGLPAGARVTALLSTWVGVAEVTVWAWAPSSRRRGGGRGGGCGGGDGLWQRLREDVALWRFGSHMLTKLLCALGVGPPPGIEAYAGGPNMLVYEGLVAPVCEMMSFRLALPLFCVRTVLNACIIYTVGRRSVLFACSWAFLVSCLGLTTTLAMHTWLGRGFLACRGKKVD